MIRIVTRRLGALNELYLNCTALLVLAISARCEKYLAVSAMGRLSRIL
jgi:hypothetical protein